MNAEEATGKACEEGRREEAGKSAENFNAYGHGQTKEYFLRLMAHPEDPENVSPPDDYSAPFFKADRETGKGSAARPTPPSASGYDRHRHNESRRGRMRCPASLRVKFSFSGRQS